MHIFVFLFCLRNLLPAGQEHLLKTYITTMQKEVTGNGRLDAPCP